jgi:hypothetical protein
MKIACGTGGTLHFALAASQLPVQMGDNGLRHGILAQLGRRK